MHFWLQFIITIGIFALMLIGGFYTYKYLNNKLTSSNTWGGIIGYSIALLAALATIYGGGFLLMGLIYKYLTT